MYELSDLVKKSERKKNIKHFHFYLQIQFAKYSFTACTFNAMPFNCDHMCSRNPEKEKRDVKPVHVPEFHYLLTQFF